MFSVWNGQISCTPVFPLAHNTRLATLAANSVSMPRLKSNYQLHISDSGNGNIIISKEMNTGIDWRMLLNVFFPLFVRQYAQL